MRDIPARQFGLFTVVIEDYIEGHEKLFQTFSDAFDYISKYAKGAEIFEVESDSFRVVYTFISRKTNGYIKFTTATIRASSRSSTTASGCRRRMITARSNSTSLNRKSIRQSSSPPRRATMSASMRQTLPNSSSAPRGFSTPRSSSARSKDRSTI